MLDGSVDLAWRIDHAVAQFMTLWHNSRRGKSAARKVSEFMPTWPLQVPPRPTTAQVTMKLEAWLGMHQAAAAARRGPPAAVQGRGPSGAVG